MLKNIISMVDKNLSFNFQTDCQYPRSFQKLCMPCAYIFLESKDASTYIESLEQIKNNAFNRNLERFL